MRTPLSVPSIILASGHRGHSSNLEVIYPLTHFEVAVVSLPHSTASHTTYLRLLDSFGAASPTFLQQQTFSPRLSEAYTSDSGPVLSRLQLSSTLAHGTADLKPLSSTTNPSNAIDILTFQAIGSALDFSKPRPSNLCYLALLPAEF